MGIADRDYSRRVPNQASRGGRLSAWSVNTWIIVINCAVHVLASTVFYTPPTATRGPWSLLHEYGHFSTAKAFVDFSQGHTILTLEVWRFITFQFLHSFGIWHLLLNMFGLYVFGGMVEQYLGRKKYLAFYLVCGIFGALMYLLLNLVGSLGLALPGALDVNPHTPLVGASAGVFGVILACAYISPNSVVQLIFPPIPMRLKYFAYGYVFLAALNLFMGGRNAGGDAAHLGGAIAGFFFIRNSHLLLDFFDILGDSRKSKVPGAQGGLRPKGVSREVDRILSKVSREGIASLTEDERRTLERASRRDRA